MAKLVLAAGVPHPPRLVRDIAESPGKTKLDALTSGAVGKLYQMGVHTYLLNHLYRYELFGVNRDNYLSRIREGLEYDERFEQGKMPIQYFVKE